MITCAVIVHLTSKDFRFKMRVWFLKETKSVCTSCATGCNIVIGSREEKVFRYEPRENDAVNSCWMCDYGRLNYKWIGREDRLTRIAGAKANVSNWPAVLGEISEVLRRATPGSVAVIASARHTPCICSRDGCTDSSFASCTCGGFPNRGRIEDTA